jgi:hypothetical protein
MPPSTTTKKFPGVSQMICNVSSAFLLLRYHDITTIPILLSCRQVVARDSTKFACLFACFAWCIGRRFGGCEWSWSVWDSAHR